MNTTTPHTTKYKNSPLGLIPEDWEVKKISEVTEYVDYRGKTPKKTDSGILLLTARNIKQGYIDYNVSKEYISEDDYANVMSRGLPEIGDVLVTTEAPMGNVAQINRLDVALAQRIIKFRAKSKVITNDYLKYYLLSEKFQRILDEKSTGGTVKGIKGSTLHKMVLISPSLQEQKAIADCLSTWDKAIEKQNALIAQKELSKKALMQQLLSGKKRLKGFSDKWKILELSKIADVRDGTHESPKYLNKGVKFITSKNIKDGELDFSNVSYISEEDADNFNRRSKVHRGDILMSMIGTIGNSVIINSEPDFCIKNVGLVKPKSINSNFLIQYFHSTLFQNYLLGKQDGGIQKFISLSGLRNLKIPNPSIEEQISIANLLKCADEELQLLKKKLEQLKEQKKGLMQVLLTGKKRLKY